MWAALLSRSAISGVTDGGAGGEPSPWQAKCKNWPPLAHILIFRIILVFSRLLYFAFFRIFSFFLAGIDIRDTRIHYHFITFFWVLAGSPPTVGWGPPSAKFFPPLHKPPLRHWLTYVLFLEYISTFFMRNEIISENIQNCQNILLLTLLILHSYNQWRK